MSHCLQKNGKSYVFKVPASVGSHIDKMLNLGKKKSN